MADPAIEASPYVRAQNNLGTLGLHEMSALLPDYMRMVSEGDADFCSAVAQMTQVEVEARTQRITRLRIRSSGFPCVKTLADFDWSFQPSVPRPLVEELATLRFVDRAENVLLVGSPGVGKTHLATAIGIEAVKAGKEVRFIDCARLVDDLKDAQSRGILKKRLKYYAHSKLLIIDELGYLDIDEGGADLLFQLVSTRYEQGVRRRGGRQRHRRQDLPPLPRHQDNRPLLQAQGRADGKEDERRIARIGQFALVRLGIVRW